ncbi:MAG: cupin domain-containing protein [Candidatus Diapherotrites archaeon]|nr:cupin domain-containing protein [Candidatus Diapherotrites archaeon]
MKHIKQADLKFNPRFVYKKHIYFGEEELGKGGKLQIIKFPPNTSLEAHFHKKTREVYYVISGTCIVTVNEKPVELEQGDVLFLDINDSHQLTTGKKEFIFLVWKTGEEETDIYWKK